MILPLQFIVIHCAYTLPEMDIGVRDIDRWHRDRGWKSCGYHYVIRRDGRVENGRHENTMGAHVKGFNESSIGVCLVGGKGRKGPDCNYTSQQWDELHRQITTLTRKHPDADVVGHRDLNSSKECPVFSVRDWWNEGDS